MIRILIVIHIMESVEAAVFGQFFFHPRQSHGRCLICVTRGSQPRGRNLLAPFTGNKQGSEGLTNPQVRPTPTRFPMNKLYGTGGQITIAFHTLCVVFSYAICVGNAKH